ncbi:MAG: response regulator, partial [Gammaproteobacteria bacterium]|nr:response regulator [Gammaproteobacteria bacterium]
GDYVLISLTDTGCGIDSKIIDQIFDPFFSTKGDMGTGLGLSQTFGFVKRYGGAINVISELNQGSQFNLYFPRYTDNNEEKTTDTNEDEFTKEGNESILIVDDEEALLDFASIALDKNGYKVYTAESGTQALQILKTNNIDLILSDIIMPKMNGYELAVIVHEQYPNVKIQLVSGYDDEKYIDLIDEKLQENIIHKPISIQTMLKSIRRLLDSTSKDSH